MKREAMDFADQVVAFLEAVDDGDDTRIEEAFNRIIASEIERAKARVNGGIDRGNPVSSIELVTPVEAAGLMSTLRLLMVQTAIAERTSDHGTPSSLAHSLGVAIGVITQMIKAYWETFGHLPVIASQPVSGEFTASSEEKFHA